MAESLMSMSDQSRPASFFAAPRLTRGPRNPNGQVVIITMATCINQSHADAIRDLVPVATGSAAVSRQDPSREQQGDTVSELCQKLPPYWEGAPAS
jgi:hypothetical protein